LCNTTARSSWAFAGAILRNEHHAEDACQATFLVLARKAAAIRKRESLASWLYGVAYRVASKPHTDIKRRAAQDVTGADVARPDTTAEITWRVGLVVLDEELSRLPATYRSALILCYLEGRTQDEAAKELGCSLGALCGRLVRARERLRTRLVRRGVGVPVALLATVLISTHAAAALPPALAVGTGRAVFSLLAGQALTRVVPANVAALTQGVLTTMFITRVKVGLGLMFTVGLLTAGAGALAGAGRIERETARRSTIEDRGSTSAILNPQSSGSRGDKKDSAAPPVAAPKGDKKGTVAVSGRVLDPEGKPVAGARLHQVHHPQPRAVSDALGQFHFVARPSDFQLVLFWRGGGL
jgi:RNA polymerase sigma factor (sigma-70 family)